MNSPWQIIGRLACSVALLFLIIGRAAAGGITVDIFNNFFQPNTVTVNVGDTVTWMQRGFNHSTESLDINPATGQLFWQSAILAPGETFSFTFNVPPGAYRYRCFPHRSFMFGTVNVVAPPNDPPTVAVSSPQNGSTFPAGSAITINADATDNDGIAQVKFFVNGSSVGIDNTFPYAATITNLPAGNYSLSALATDTRGASSTSAVVNIVVTMPTAAPVITSPPQSVATNAGSTVAFQVSATGDPPLSYQWFHSSTALGAQTGNSLVLSNVQTNDSGNYTVIVSNPGGSTTGGPATLTVITQPIGLSVIIFSPTNGATFGTNRSVTVAAAVSGGPLTKVEFFVRAAGVSDLTKLGEANMPPYETAWRPAIPGDYHLSAVASDAFGSSATLSDILIHISPDSDNPILRLTTSPPDFSRLRTPTVTLSGTASDENLARVEYSLNQGGFQPVSGTSSWTVEIPLVAGTNVIRVQAADLAGNTAAVTRSYFYVVTAPLTVAVNGSGTVAPNFNGRELEIGGRFYQMAAIPGPGQIFGGWDGATISNKAVLNFQMQSNLALTANFVPNPFSRVSGLYAGLIFDPANVIPKSSGFLKLYVTGRGTFSGAVTVQGATYPLHGQFDHRGSALVPVVRRSARPVVLDLSLALGNESGEITGTMTGPDWAATIRGERLIFNARAMPTPLAGLYGIDLKFPGADGGLIALAASIDLKVFSSGIVLVRTAIVSPFRQTFGLKSVILSAENEIPFYLSFGRDRQVIVGWLQYSAAPAPTFLGNLWWRQEIEASPLTVAPAAAAPVQAIIEPHVTPPPGP